MIRKFLEFAIDRPALNHIFMFFMIIMSIFAYRGIPKEIFPPSQLDQVAITGVYVGASADVLDKMVVKTLEDKLKELAEIDTVYTTIRNGFFSIFADVLTGNDTQAVLGDVKDIVSNIRRDIPSDMDEPVAKIVVRKFPLLMVAVSGQSSTDRLLEVANILKNRLSLIPHINEITIRGDSDEEILISLDSKKIEAYGLSKSSIYTAISSLSTIFPIGTVKQKGNHLYISTISGEKSKKKLEETLLSIDGKHFYLNDIATVTFGHASPEQISHYNGKPNIALDIQKSAEGNAIDLSKRVKETLVEFNKKYQGEIEFETYTDTSIWIKNRLNLVSSNIIFGLILVFFALFLTLNLRISLVVGIGIPTSFMITLIVAQKIGYSLNLITLMGTLIALGMLVDEAIVVAENIYRHLEMGKTPREASIDGAVEMFPAIITATFTTIFAFLPLLIMTGQMGVFMRVLPVMISILLLSSLFEAFYFLPLHAKEFFSIGRVRRKKSKESLFWRVLKRIYQWILALLLRFKHLSLLLLLGLIIWGTGEMLKVTKFQFMPKFDVTQVYINGKVDINNELKDTEKYVTILEKKLLKLDKNAVDSVTSIIGYRMNSDKSFEVGENLFQIVINLHEKAPENVFDTYVNPIFSVEYNSSDMIRKKQAQEIVVEVQENVLNDIRELSINGEKIFEEINIFAQQTGMVGNDIEIGFSHTSQKRVLDALRRVEENLSKMVGVHDIGDNASKGEQELKLRVNEYGQSLGLSEGYISNALRGSFFKGEYGKMFNSEGLLRIKIEDSQKDKQGSIENFNITTPENKIVQLKEVCDFFYQRGFVRVFKEDGQKVRMVHASVEGNNSKGEKIISSDIMKELKPLLESLEEEGLNVIVKGEAKANNQLIKEMMEASVIALFLIFITLVWMFNSFVQPLIVLMIIPLSVLGVLVGTKVMGMNMTATGAMGLVGLAGVVVNDGLIMLEFVRKSKNLDEILEYAGTRLRPIILTSVTTVLGLSSLMFFASGQALILQPMAISLGFGIAWATVLNLYFVPLMYAVIYRIKKEEKREIKKEETKKEDKLERIKEEIWTKRI